MCGKFGKRVGYRVSILVVALVWGMSARSSLGDALSIISPNPQTVSYGASQIGTLKITNYGATTNGDGTVGAGIVAEFTQTYMPTCNLSLQWVQSIIGGQGTIGQSLGGAIPYLDPYKRDDNLPFYWTNGENSTLNVGKLNATAQPGSRFADFPSQPPTAGNSITFETALVAVSPTDPLGLIWLAGFEWGYTINADLTSSVFAFGWTNGPGVDLKGPVEAWNGTQGNYVGGPNYNAATFGNAVGYKFVDAGTLPPCPLPSSSVMLLTLLTGFGGWTYVRQRLAFNAEASAI